MNSPTHVPPPDQAQRQQALDPRRSTLVRAPAGSGKTDLLTRRFLRLLTEVDDPSQIVAITFTKASAAEMRHRIVSELEKAASYIAPPSADPFSMEALASRALGHLRARNWNLIDLPAQLRISTIDSFCRELALQQPLLSGLGGALDIAEQPDELYRRAVRRTLEQLAGTDRSLSASDLTSAIETLLLWRDNNWQELEDQLVEMLAKRDRWMQDFVLEREQDWEALRERLEGPFARAVRDALHEVARLLALCPGACEEALELARFACGQSNNTLHRELAEMAELPLGPFQTNEELEAARLAHLCMRTFLLTGAGSFRKLPNKSHGFPPDRKREKQRFAELIRNLNEVPGLEAALAGIADLPPAQYTEDEWTIVRSCFALLRHSAGELRVVFAEAGMVDFVEVAQIAQRVLQADDGEPSDAAIAVADGIHHLLVDEFQDTSRRQHQLIGSLVAAWPDAALRTVFVVGDPMQSIYFFRDADAELFPRVQNVGLELPAGIPFPFRFVPLASNFRTAPGLVKQLNTTFEEVFAANDGSGIQFSPSEPARQIGEAGEGQFRIHLEFVPQTPRSAISDPDAAQRKETALNQRAAALESQTNEIVSLIQSYSLRIEAARAHGKKYRIAVLGRTRTTLAIVAQALRDAGISFRALDLEPLADRPEVLDAVALARALFNAEDRVAWLGVLRAPWCGLSLADLHILTSADDPEVLPKQIPSLLRERDSLLSPEGQRAVHRLQSALDAVPALRESSPGAALGTWLKLIWKRLGGSACTDATARANLDMLWAALDALPDGEPDLPGTALTAALENLKAQPDPSTSSEHGVQLMTIHKSKGLEFEVVIVPDLQARGGRPTSRPLSWLERGLSKSDQSGEVTEFLIAPFPSKGAERGKAKAWVDRAYRQREQQEMRRVLYVAATRAREELHLFARPAFKQDKSGDLVLCQPSQSLLSTAWPALEEDVVSRFQAWKTEQREPVIESIAAQAGGNLLQMPMPTGVSKTRPAKLRRLPIEYEVPLAPGLNLTAPAGVVGAGNKALYSRHEGGLQSRVLGTAVHAYFEELARLRATQDWDQARSGLSSSSSRVAAHVRATGIARDSARQIADQALQIAVRASAHPIAEWILSPHADAESEVQWVGVIEGDPRTVRVDRVFRAGDAPLEQGEGCWWIIDYKTALIDDTDPAKALENMRPLFAPQLMQYAQLLRNLRGNSTSFRAGLFYPRMLQFDWWKV